jgi:hypothetical protein
MTTWAAMLPATPDNRALRLAQAMAKKYVPARVA